MSKKIFRTVILFAVMFAIFFPISYVLLTWIGLWDIPIMLILGVAIGVIVAKVIIYYDQRDIVAELLHDRLRREERDNRE